ncbi:ROK family glucokinase [Fictibacillus aquaticus]|uniref:Glucokinase n=1 Tax=Fictibacillus aquaticus TaxID=2021314 RepID=A0A235F956_9BACL|nr:ROK family glucokinase [Fictibacillus aquaticus]OYD57836.1 glucokinase [Fictibacillus aquaticus]
MAEQWLTGIDVGGTTIKMAFVSMDGELIHKWEIPTDVSEGGLHITKHISSSLRHTLSVLGQEESVLKGIGLGAPGFIEMKTGFIHHAVNIGWKNYPLKDELEKETGLPVTVENDANMAAIGEMWKGAGNGESDLLCVTLGTGVGGGIILNGQIVHGVNGMAGEIGHITSIPEGGAACNCGKTGCIETIASATGISRIAALHIESNKDSSLYKVWNDTKTITAKDVAISAADGDEFASEVLEKVTFHLGLVIANLSNSINPGMIVIGGGVSSAGETLLMPLRRHFEKFALPRVAEGAQFAIATLGNDAGVIGGAWLAKQNMR